MENFIEEEVNFSSVIKQSKHFVYKPSDHRTIDQADIVRRATEKMFKDGILTDVVLRVGPMRLKCHRAFLAGYSEYFRAMLAGGTAESCSEEIELHDITPESFAPVIRYLYTGRITLTLANAWDLLLVADRFQVEPLVCECRAYLLAQVSVKTCCAMLQHALRCPLPVHDIHDASLDVVVAHFHTVTKTHAWAALDADAVYEVLSRDDIGAEEGRIFTAAMDWAVTALDRMESEQEKEEALNKVLSTLRSGQWQCKVRWPPGHAVLRPAPLFSQPHSGTATKGLLELNQLITEKRPFLNKEMLTSLLCKTGHTRDSDSLPKATGSPRSLESSISKAMRCVRYTQERQGWGYQGCADEIEISFSRPVHLRGIAIFGKAGAVYNISLDVLKTNGKGSVLAKGPVKDSAFLFDRAVVDVLFDSPPPLLKPNVNYVISLVAIGPTSPYGGGCHTVMTQNEITITVHKRTSPNYTDETKGQFAALIFSPF